MTPFTNVTTTDWTKPVYYPPGTNPTYTPVTNSTYTLPPEDWVKELVSSMPTEEVAIKYDSGKSLWHLMPFEAVEEINKVLEFGAKKYAEDNWKVGKGLGIRRVLNSGMRHLFAYMRGEKVDPETGLSHLAHLGCNILFAIYYEKYKEKYSNE